jgi:hypothetical protein
MRRPGGPATRRLRRGAVSLSQVLPGVRPSGGPAGDRRHADRLHAGAPSVRSGQEALAIARPRGDRSIEVVATSFLGMTHVARGEFSAAAIFLERNVALEGDLRSERFGTPAMPSALSGACFPDLLSELGRFVAATGADEDAAGHYRQAVALAEELGMLVAPCHPRPRQNAPAHWRGRAGREHLSLATTMYREMDMPFGLEQAEAEPGTPTHERKDGR